MSFITETLEHKDGLDAVEYKSNRRKNYYRDQRVAMIIIPQTFCRPERPCQSSLRARLSNVRC